MTASPNRPRSQNAENALTPEATTPVREPFKAGAAPLRTLPPTLFKLRNLNAQPPAVADSPTEQVEVESEPISASLPIHDSATVATQSVSADGANASIGQRVDSRDSVVDASPRRSFASRISSQSLVLFVILAIAITGIVVGNRGSEDGNSIADAPEATDELQLAGMFDIGTEVSADEVTSASELYGADVALDGDGSARKQAGAELAAKARHNQAVNQPHADANSSAGVSVNPSSNAALNASATINSPIVVAQTTQSNSGIAQTSTPNGVQQNLVGQLAGNAKENPTGTGVAKNSDADSRYPTASGNTNSFESDTPAVAMHAGASHATTRTPAGIDDWSRYLPSAGANANAYGTVAATSATPQSPIAGYQQYLDSLTPNLPQTTAPVGYLADPADVYGANTVGTQAQLPTSTYSSQQR